MALDAQHGGLRSPLARRSGRRRKPRGLLRREEERVSIAPLDQVLRISREYARTPLPPRGRRSETPIDRCEHAFYHARMPEDEASERQRRCTLCGVEKLLSEFHRRREGHQWWCKACRRAYDAKYHARTRALRIRQMRERKRRLAEWLYELKTSQPCIDCRGRFHHSAMTFDHLPGRAKRDDVSNLVHRGCSKLARDEISKCDVVCANCHAVRTFLRRSSGGPNSLQESAVS